MRHIAATLGLVYFLLFSSYAAIAQSNDDATWEKVQALQWQFSPSVAKIGQWATIKVSNDLAFLDSVNTSQFLQLNGNPPRDDNYTIAKTDYSWFAVFGFDEIGYVKDDQIVDADQLLSELKSNNKAGITERKKLHLPILNLVGWAVSPHYDSSTHHLEWGTKLLDENNEITLNYSIRILGRRGVMRVLLVSSPSTLNADITELKAALHTFAFNPGDEYAEYKSGDTLSEYGLGALIVGGAAAAVAKTGAGKALFKFLGVGLLALFGAVIAFFRGLFGRKA